MLLLLLGLLLLVTSSDLLITPSVLARSLLLSHAWHRRRLHEERGAGVCDCLYQRVVSPPLFDGASLDMHRLLVHVIE